MRCEANEPCSTSFEKAGWMITRAPAPGRCDLCHAGAARPAGWSRFAARGARRRRPLTAMLVISCHADTGFAAHRLERRAGGTLHGHLDNFAGVHAVMRAYFSGGLDRGNVRIELTAGEEIDMAGAYRVRSTLAPDDLVVVVDVTGVETAADFTIEKCRLPEVADFVVQALAGLDYALFAESPDPISVDDECDVYAETQPFTFFLGIPGTGGDYNVGEVRCREASLAAAAEALVRLARAHDEAWD
jgi:hypothetical protein